MKNLSIGEVNEGVDHINPGGEKASEMHYGIISWAVSDWAESLLI